MRSHTIPLLLFAFSLTLRLFLMSKGPYHGDCLFLAMAAKEFLNTHQLTFYFGTGYPLMILLGALMLAMLKIGGMTDPVFALNLLSVICGSLCVPMIYLVTRKLTDQKTALFSSLLLNINPIFLGISTYGISHSVVLLLVLVGIYLLIQHAHRPQALMLCGLILGLCGAVRIQDMVILLVPFTYLFFTTTTASPNRTKKFLAFLAILLFTTLLFYIPFFFPNQLNQTLTTLKDSFSLTGNNYQLFSLLPLQASVNHLFIALTPIGFLLSIVGLIFIVKLNHRLAIFLLLWIICPLALYGNMISLAPRYLTILQPPFIIAGSYALSRLLNQGRVGSWATLGGFTLIACLSLQSILPLVTFRHQHALMVDFAHWVAANTEPNAVIITVDHNHFLEFYSQRRSPRRPANDFTLNEKNIRDFREQIKDWLNDGIPVYITSPGLYAYNAQKKFSTMILANFKLRSVGEKIVEDWYLGEIYERIGPYELLQITGLRTPS